MEEEEINYPEALEILKKKLKEQNLEYDTNNHDVLNVRLDLKSYFWGYGPSYNHVNITIRVKNGSKKGGLRNFDIINGDYKKLKEKIENLSAISEENKKYQKEMEIKDKEAREKAKEDLKDISCDKIEDIEIGRDLHLRCGWNDIHISIDENGSYTLKYFDPVDLRNKKISKELLDEFCKMAKDFSNLIDKLNGNTKERRR